MSAPVGPAKAGVQEILKYEPASDEQKGPPKTVDTLRRSEIVKQNHIAPDVLSRTFGGN